MTNNTSLAALAYMQQRVFQMAQEAAGMPLEGVIDHLDLLAESMPDIDREGWEREGHRIRALRRMAALLQDVANEYTKLQSESGVR